MLLTMSTLDIALAKLLVPTLRGDGLSPTVVANKSMRVRITMLIPSLAKKVYRWLSVLVFSGFLMVVVANGAFYVALLFKEHLKAFVAPSNPVGERYGESLRDAYPELSFGEINDLLVETWTRSFAYDPVVQFREGSYKGRYVNVADAGFRHSTSQGPWPPSDSSYNIFVFGSSSTFGYGLPDGQTVPSFLQQQLGEIGGRPVKIYNFGRGHYYSTQERRLFERLLMDGIVPDGAIFIDGLSEFSHSGNRLPYSGLLGEALDSGFLSRLGWMFDAMPLQRLLFWFRKRILRRSGVETKLPIVVGGRAPTAGEMGPEQVATLSARYLLNAKLIAVLAESYGVDVVFVWQPVSTYRVEPGAVPLKDVDMGAHAFAGRAYEQSRSRLENHPAGNRFLWCADVQAGVTEALYVDAVHYNARAASLFAGCISKATLKRNLLTNARRKDR